MFKNILVPTDGSKLSDKAVAHAVALAKSAGAKLTALTVTPVFHMRPISGFSPPDSMLAPVRESFEKEASAKSRKILDTACATASAAGVACAGVQVRSESPFDAIIKQATKSKCDLILMASHGRRGLDAVLLGSETQKVLTHTKIPVLVVR